MKILLTLFFLFFSSSVVADDISEFQIEGISIGDSLLDYMSENDYLIEKQSAGQKKNRKQKNKISQDKFIIYYVLLKKYTLYRN